MVQEALKLRGFAAQLSAGALVEHASALMRVTDALKPPRLRRDRPNTALLGGGR